jgi:hypothetical protein
VLLYTTDVINSADAPAVGLAMAETLRDDLIVHDAWELVEEFTPSTIRWYVFRCLASESGLPSDFYAVMGLTLSSGSIRIGICEDYNPSTHVMSHFPNTLTGSQIAFDAQGRSGATFTLNTTFFGTPRSHQWTPSGTSTKFWLIAAEDGFSVAFNGASNGFIHVGAYEPLIPTALDMPIQSIGSADSDGGITRNPCVAGLTTYDVALSINGGGSTNINFPVLGFRGAMSRDDKLQGPGRALAEVGMIIYEWISNGEPIIGWALGKQKRMRVGNNPPGSFVWGDAYVVEGTLWVPYLPNDPRVWDTGVDA